MPYCRSLLAHAYLSPHCPWFIMARKSTRAQECKRVRFGNRGFQSSPNYRGRFFLRNSPWHGANMRLYANAEQKDSHTERERERERARERERERERERARARAPSHLLASVLLTGFLFFCPSSTGARSTFAASPADRVFVRL